MAWVVLFVAGLLEMAWALLLKQSNGFTRPGPAIGFVVTLALSMYLLSVAVRTLPVGSAYAVWTGIGAAGTAIVGMLWLGESRDMLKLVSLVGSCRLSMIRIRLFPSGSARCWPSAMLVAGHRR